MKNILTTTFCLWFLMMANCGMAEAQTNNGTLEGISYEIMLNNASADVGGTPVNVLFTTYDGNRYSLPYYYDTSTSIIYYSRELKKIGGNYLTDYYMITSSAIVDYGEMILNLGNIDLNNNEIDDVCEKEKSFSADVLGNWYSQDGSSDAISGTINRTAGQQQGDYSLLVYNTGAGDLWFSGSFFIGTLGGSISYTMFSQNIEIDFTTTWDDDYISSQVSTTYDIIDQDTIRINGTENIPDTTLARSGNTYSAILELIDGNLGTSWPDYQKWFITITDNNDSDLDGIPDLSDACPLVSLTWLMLLLDD